MPHTASDQARRQMQNMLDRGCAVRAQYLPGRDGQRPREIIAIVNRSKDQEHLSGQAVAFDVTVLNDWQQGIPSDPELSDFGTDRISIADRRDGKRIERSIRKLLDDADPDFLILRVQ